MNEKPFANITSAFDKRVVKPPKLSEKQARAVQ